MRAAEAPWICLWPQSPERPPRGRSVVVRVAVSRSRPAARSELRVVLRKVLAAWSGLQTDRLPLSETPRGPVWEGPLCGQKLDISLSYGPGEAWIGLRQGGAIGVDVMGIEPVSGADEVARDYLGPRVAEAIRQAARPAQVFALAWTDREARLKCLKRGLNEWSAAHSQIEANCACHRMILGDRLAGAVATRSDAEL